ncbi:MAG: hypothetical protein AAF480_14630 [Actinomycetota bacterium]
MAGTFALAPSRLGPRGIRLPRQSDLRALLVALLTAALIASVLTVAEDPFATDAPTTSQEGSLSSAVDTATSSSQTVLPGEVPEGLTAAEWADIQSQIAARQGSTAVSAQPAPLLQAPATVAELPLTITPTTTAPTDAAPPINLALPSAAVMSSAGIDAAFSPTGATITTASSASPVGLSTSTIGSGPVGSAVVVETAAGVELVRAGVTEYFHTVAEGIEHGYVIDTPMHAGGDLVIRVDVAASGLAFVGEDVLIDRADGTQLWYRDLFVFDATGAELPASMGIDGTTITLNVDTTGAVYPITVDPTITEDQQLLPNADAANELYGFSVALDDSSGDTILVVGAPFDDDQGNNRGTAYVYRDSGSGFVFEANLYSASTASAATNQRFGWDVDVRGETVVVGAPDNDDNGSNAGAVYIFEPTGGGGAWQQTGIVYQCDPGVTSPCGDTIGVGAGFADADFGYAVDLSDQGLLVGAPGFNGDAGFAAIFTRAGNLWRTTPGGVVPTLGPGAAGDLAGYAVSMADAGTHLVVGAPGIDAFAFTDNGQSYYLRWNGTSYTTPLVLNTGGGNDHNSGAAVAVEVDSGGDDTWMFVGEPINRREEDGTQPGSDIMWTYRLATADAPIAANRVSLGGTFGSGGKGIDIDFDGGRYIFGEYLSDSGATDRGSVTYFPVDGVANSVGTGQVQLLPNNAGDNWGFSVASEGDTYVIGGPGNDTAGADSGQIRIRSYSVFLDEAVNPFVANHGDRYGFEVSVSGNRLAVGSHRDSSAASSGGAVYMYERADSTSPWTADGVIVSPSPEARAHFGDSLSVFGDRVAIGESDRLGNQAEGGIVYVFERTGAATWTSAGSVGGAVTYDGFGASVALYAEDRLFVGAPAEGSAGEVFHFTESGPGLWFSQGALPVVGVLFAGDQLGYSIAVDRDNDVLIAGAPFNDTAGADAGAVLLWDNITTGAGVPSFISGPGWDAGDMVGTSVAASNGTYAAAGIGDGSGGSDRQAHLIKPVVGYAVIASISDTQVGSRVTEPNHELALIGENLFWGQGAQVELYRDIDGSGFQTTAPPTELFDTAVP